MIINSFDVWHHHLPFIEVYGTEGSISVPDPNTFGGPVFLRRAGEDVWHEVPLTHGYTENSRGLGLVDMSSALHSDCIHRANGELAYHVLDVIEAFLQSSREGKHIILSSSCSRPEPFTPGKQSWE